MFWRRFAAIGWATIYSMLLHLILILTGKDRKLKKIHYFLLYLPAVVNIFIYSVLGNVASGQYNLVKIDHGWVNIAVNNIWDILFYIYYIGYVVLCIILIIDWKKKSYEVEIKKQANLMLISIISMLIIGTLADVVLNSYLQSPLPQISPVFTLIPVFAVMYSTKNNSHLLKLAEREDDLILGSEGRSKLYLHAGTLYLIGGTLSFSSIFFSDLIHVDEVLLSTILSSIFLFLFGVLIFIFQVIQNEKLKDFLIVSAILISIPVINLIFVESAAITIWVFPIIAMIISLLFTNNTPLLLITLVSIVTQILVWIYAPNRIVRIQDFDYIFRIVIIFMSFRISIMINKTYVNKLEKNIAQVEYQKIISETSSDLLHANSSNIDEIINSLLKKLGKYFEVDRAYLLIINYENNTLSSAYEWCDKGIKPEIEMIMDTPLEMFTWWINQLKDQGQITINNIGEMDEPLGLKEELIIKNVKSKLMLPIIRNDNIYGFIGFDCVKTYKNWTEEHISSLRSIVNMLSTGISKIKSEDELQYMAYYDHLTGLANRTLFKDRAEQSIQLAKRTGNFIAIIFIDVDCFKMINDTMGHDVGDQLLKHVANRLLSLIRNTDTAARLGGDEFLIMLNNIKCKKDITMVAEKIMDTFKEPFYIDEQEFFITSSSGIAIFPANGEDIDILIKNADIAMYEAKSNGKNQYALYTPDIKQEII